MKPFLTLAAGALALGLGAVGGNLAAPTLLSAAPAALPPPAKVRAAAVEARKQLWHAPAGTQFRSMRAVMIPGQYNGETPGKAYVGFCGEINIPNARAHHWGRPGWKPIHVSATRSSVPGQTWYMNQADTIQPTKCAGQRSPQDYSAIFNNPARLQHKPTKGERREAIVRGHPPGYHPKRESAPSPP